MKALRSPDVIDVGASAFSFAPVLRKARRGSLAIVKIPVNTKLQRDVAKNSMRFTIYCQVPI